MHAQKNKIMILAGGTGGHVMPALAVAHYLLSLGHQIHWLGTRDGIEARLVEQANIPISYIQIKGIRRNGILKMLMSPFKIVAAILSSIKILRREKPNCVLSMGGYVAGPGGIAAWLLGIPLIVHEQNSIAGLTNRILSKFAKKVMVAFPQAFANNLKVIDVGNPIRQDILTIDAPEIRYKEANHPLVLLILGGSQGATAINELVPKAIALLPSDKRPKVIHQTGARDFSSTKAAYSALGLEAQVCEFISDMKSAYAAADLLIARSGALTIAEVSCVGIASIFIPFPYAVDNHQKFNAQYLSQHNGAVLVEQAALSPEILSKHLLELIDSRPKRMEMAMNCRNLAKPNATRVVAQQCLEVGCE